MNVYDAIMKAADHIERNPGLFNICRTGTGGNEPSCALGWIGFFGNFKSKDAYGVAEEMGLRSAVIAIPGDQRDFFGRIKGMIGQMDFQRFKYEAPFCAATLRKYAEKYHAPEKTKEPNKGIPDSVLSIFRIRATDPDKVAA